MAFSTNDSWAQIFLQNHRVPFDKNATQTLKLIIDDINQQSLTHQNLAGELSELLAYLPRRDLSLRGKVTGIAGAITAGYLFHPTLVPIFILVLLASNKAIGNLSLRQQVDNLARSPLAKHYPNILNLLQENSGSLAQQSDFAQFVVDAIQEIQTQLNHAPSCTRELRAF